MTDFFLFLLGGTLCAVSVETFTAPNQIAPGGITGISTVLHYLFGTPIGVLIFLMNIPIFLWAVWEMDYTFVLKSMIATAISSLAIDLLGIFLPTYQGDQMLAAIFGGVLDGAGLSCIFMRGGTTGGTDIAARLLGRRFRHISMGKMMMVLDASIVLISAVVFRSLESALYAFIAIFVSGRLIDVILYGLDIGTGKMIFVVSEKNRAIANTIMTELERGVTFLKSEGAYSGREGEVLLCAARRDEVHRIQDIIQNEDPNAFLIVGDAGEISGEGFRRPAPEEKTLRGFLRNRREK